MAELHVPMDIVQFPVHPSVLPANKISKHGAGKGKKKSKTPQQGMFGPPPPCKLPVPSQ